VAWFRNEENLQFENGILASLKDLMYLEIFGAIKADGTSRHLRFCADMVYSGHTYFATLFSLGVYDMLRKSTIESGRSGRKGIWLLGMVSVLLTGVVLADVILMLMNRFHYTIDVFLAILIVYLYYTNAPLARAVDWWSDELWVPKNKQRLVELSTKSYKSGEVMIPPCFPCPPFCLMYGRYYLTKEDADSSTDRLIFTYLMTHPEEFADLLELAANHEDNESRYRGVDSESGRRQAKAMKRSIADLKDEGRPVNHETLMSRLHPDGDKPETFWMKLQEVNCHGSSSDDDDSKGGF